MNIDKTEISDKDLNYDGLIDLNFENAGDKVTLTCGTDSIYIDRGKILKYTNGEYSSIKEWSRAGQTDIIEKLLLRSLSSNYNSSYIKLNNMILNNNFNIKNILTDNGISGKKMMVTGATINFQDSIIKCSLTEISGDKIDITIKNI